jgi:hypothetical protein
MQIRKNIEYKYSLLTKKKSVRTIRREDREFYTHSWEIKRETLTFQEAIQDLELIDAINTWERMITKKLNKKKRNEGVENLQLVEDQDLNLYRVRYSKHDKKKIHF